MVTLVDCNTDENILFNLAVAKIFVIGDSLFVEKNLFCWENLN